MRILVVEDDVQVAQTIRLGLVSDGYRVDLAADGEHALHSIRSGEYDLVVLDVMIPKRDGLDVLRELRSRGLGVPVLILSAREGMEDRVLGLDAGADDYLTKPFGLRELRARVRALLRRRGSLLETHLCAGDLELDVLRRRATRGGRALDLTLREFAILELLVRHLDLVVTRSHLVEKVWGYNFDTPSNVVDVHIAHLRGKIDADFPVKLLHTVRGQGYCVRSPEGVASGEAGTERRTAGKRLTTAPARSRP